MSTAPARIKLQTWDWIQDQVASACNVFVYDPATLMPVSVGTTSTDGYLEFEIPAGMYVIWVWGHNPMGYRPFLSDTWIPIAVVPGETLEVCAALVSLVDIPVLYNAALAWTEWVPHKFAELLDDHASKVVTLCNETAIQQQKVLLKVLGDLKEGVIQRVEEPIDVRGELLERRREWAEKAVRAAKEHAPKRVKDAKTAGQEAIEGMERRMGALPKVS